MMFRASLAVLSVLAGLVLSGLPAPAQTVDATAAGKEAKTRQNVDIESDTMEIFDKEKKAVFKGKVKAVRGKVTLTCEMLNVIYTETPDPKAQGEKKTEVT